MDSAEDAGRKVGRPQVSSMKNKKAARRAAREHGQGTPHVKGGHGTPHVKGLIHKQKREQHAVSKARGRDAGEISSGKPNRPTMFVHPAGEVCPACPVPRTHFGHHLPCTTPSSAPLLPPPSPYLYFPTSTSLPLLPHVKGLILKPARVWPTRRV